MKKILHLSDLHFGTEIPHIFEALIPDCQRLNPDIIIISGDLTQRAKHDQYDAAKQFIDNFEGKVILCVPGNHDISFYNLFERFLYPFAKYQKWIAPDVYHHYSDDELSILGINSVTAFKPLGGYVTERQLELVGDYFKTQASNVVRIIVMHHNLISSERHRIINDADKILARFADAGVNLVLSGHTHFPCIEKVQKQFIKHNLYVMTAGTAISTRTKAPNSYNVLEINKNEFTFLVREFDGNRFSDGFSSTYPL